jgi:tetratricopeptide (TPR) repeat protein
MDCVEYALARQAKLDARRSTAHAEFLAGRMKYKEAVQSMKKYIAGGKADARAYAVYARALAEAGQIDEAAKYFERLMAARKPSIEHVQAYVKYLTRAKRFDQALSVILRVRRTHLNALPVEYRVISEMRGAANNRVMASKR